MLLLERWSLETQTSKRMTLQLSRCWRETSLAKNSPSYDLPLRRLCLEPNYLTLVAGLAMLWTLPASQAQGI
jgi:hypothetical protein